ncbi:MAG TPA: NUDIX hydrolase [Rubrobacteraceae bacterium]|nr:NUDIX hydrolase [Rubrobacteraceae bacterium]
MVKERGGNGIDFGIRVGAVVERDGKILLVCHQKPGRAPYWVLPGGRLEPGETIPECAERELAEETGLDARFSEVLYVSEFMREGRHTVDVTVRTMVNPDEEARLGSDPEVEEGSEPTLKELRWMEVSSLRDIELLPAWIRDRLVEDAGREWRSGETYLDGGRD